MPVIMELSLDGDGAWPDLPEDVLRQDLTKPFRLSLLRAGTTSGKHSVGMLIPLVDGGCVFAELTADLFLGAAKAFIVKIEKDARM